MAKGSQAREGEEPRRIPPSIGSWRPSLGLVLSAVGLLAALTRLPLIHSPVDVSPDGCEYLGIARHLAFEHRWIASLKWNFFTDAAVIHPALADRPPLYPLYAAGWAALTNDPLPQIWLARLGNLLLAAVVPALIYWALRAVLMPGAAALAAAIYLVYPAFLRNCSQPLTEPLFLVLLLGSLGRFLRAHTAWEWVASGFLAGLATLTRPSGLLLPVVYGITLLARSPSPSNQGPAAMDGCRPNTRMEEGRPPEPHESLRRPRPSAHGWRPLFLVGLGFVLPLFPYAIAVAAQTGSPFTSVLRYNYSIRHIDEGTFYGFERAFPPPWSFVRAHTAVVARLVASQWATMGWALGRSLQFVLPLGLFWRRGAGWGQERSDARGVLAGLALLNFLFHAMSWTVWGAARYMFPSYIIALGLLLEAPLQWAATERAEEASRNAPAGWAAIWARTRTGPGRQQLAAASVAVAVTLTVAACLEQDVRLYQEKQRPFGGVPLGWAYAEAAGRLAASSPGTVCASNQPWILNLLAGRPAVMAPRFRDPAQLCRYVTRYRPESLTLFVTEREPGDVETARRLVDHLWSQPAVKPGLRDLLELEKTDRRVWSRPRQALLLFRVRGSGSAGRGVRAATDRVHKERGI